MYFCQAGMALAVILISPFLFPNKGSRNFHYGFALALAMAVAVLIELGQTMSARYASVSDVLRALAGTTAFLLYFRAWENHKYDTGMTG